MMALFLRLTRNRWTDGKNELLTDYLEWKSISEKMLSGMTAEGS
jgi:hypothetical protein